MVVRQLCEMAAIKTISCYDDSVVKIITEYKHEFMHEIQQLSIS